MKTSALIFATLTSLISAQADAAPLLDASNDFIPTYTGPQNADLDVRSTEVFLRDGVFNFTAELGGPIGTTTGGFYVFGLDRGAGTARFGAIATNVLFDSVVVINNNGTGFARDLLSGTTTTLATSVISLTGNSLSAFVQASLLPTAGRSAIAYTFNLWPRSAGSGNGTIADFAPDNANFAITAVPEPATWAMMIGGFSLIGAAARRRSREHALA